MQACCGAKRSPPGRHGSTSRPYATPWRAQNGRLWSNLLGRMNAGNARSRLVRRYQVLASLAIMLACVLSGSLECHHRELTADEIHGKVLYAQMCVVCHGARGEGYKADQAPGVGRAAFLAAATDH